MQKNKMIRTMTALTLSSIAIIACSRDMDTGIKSPARHIEESENLAIPASIDLPVNFPNGNTRIATFYAIGVQKYKAQPKAGTTPTTYEWVFVAPRADLFNANNQKVGTHSAGPTWQLFGASDSIYGQQFTPAKSVASPDANSIDWLQLMPKAGKTPTGIFTNVSYIQRIATTGGKAPAILPQSASDTIDVSYTAVYRFAKKNP